jgi:hypothetical protein
MDLSLKFLDNQTGHRDLVLRFAGQSWVSDSYYLALDGGILPDREDADKIRTVLRRLLEQWLVAIDAVPDDGTLYLPYDFSDQCTGWLRCRRLGEAVEVCQGWAGVEGWSFYPSAIGDFFTHLRGFHADGPSLSASITELVLAIRQSIDELSKVDDLGRQ